MWQLVDTTIVSDNIGISRTIVSHNDLIVDSQRLRLLLECCNQGDTRVVEGGDENRQTAHNCLQK
jgi:hypothetical protein